MNGREWSYPQLYNVLGVHPEASATEIEEAYRRLRDAYQGSPERQYTLGVAWAVLGDRERRALYDRQAIGAARSVSAEALRPLVIWVAVYVTAGTFLVALGTRDIGTVALLSYAAACSPSGWRTLSRVRRWLWMRGPLSWVYCVVVSPIVGSFAAPVQFVLSAVVLARLWRARP